jgi:TetR/AcrR family transcriptional repressor of mexJK operon
MKSRTVMAKVGVAYGRCEPVTPGAFLETRETKAEAVQVRSKLQGAVHNPEFREIYGRSLPTRSPGRPKDLTKKKAILEAAKSLFLRNGYEGTSMDLISVQAEVSKQTVYSFFSNKETLFCAAVKARSEEQLPRLLFELPGNPSIESMLLHIGRNVHQLINSREALELHRVMVAMANQDPNMTRMLYEAGPRRMLQEMTSLLAETNRTGKLRIENPLSAAEHFLCLLKGGYNFRLLIGCETAQEAGNRERHVREVVELFIRAYMPSHITLHT